MKPICYFPLYSKINIVFYLIFFYLFENKLPTVLRGNLSGYCRHVLFELNLRIRHIRCCHRCRSFSKKKNVWKPRTGGRARIGRFTTVIYNIIHVGAYQKEGGTRVGFAPTGRQPPVGHRHKLRIYERWAATPANKSRILLDSVMMKTFFFFIGHSLQNWEYIKKKN